MFYTLYSKQTLSDGQQKREKIKIIAKIAIKLLVNAEKAFAILNKENILGKAAN